MRGKIHNLKESFGFVRGEDGISRFFIPSCLDEPALFDSLVVGQIVEFDHEDAPKGPRANGIRPVTATAAVPD